MATAKGSRRPRRRRKTERPVAPADRPLRPLQRGELLVRFETAVAAADGVGGAHCVHELWMRNEPSMNVEALLERLWAAARTSVPDWLPMCHVAWLALAYDVAARFQP